MVANESKCNGAEATHVAAANSKSSSCYETAADADERAIVRTAERVKLQCENHVF